MAEEKKKLSAGKKKFIGIVVGVMLAFLGAVFGVDLSKLNPSISDQIEEAVIEGQLAPVQLEMTTTPQ